ncbi:PLP-dependent transferase [Wolfiporia cocos MD-104 SS10]|uniref:PLP-dependent transferase n=1 Tax=Wolfiporia cocos (strain MD-104) TaxID=742152 RepID=A0A2H3JUI2_WOLCO|nr:PLP-dependent transferase [Wolfiporia cocos MD-104 SS10]
MTAATGTRYLSGDKPDCDSYDMSASPPPFGHQIKRFWAFESEFVNLNHGSYGSTPLPVLYKCSELTMLSERNPDLFHRILYLPMLNKARERVADLIGADCDEVVLIPNATHGINTILRNLEWHEGDVIMGASTTYGAISKTIQYISDRAEPPRPRAHVVTLTFPMSHSDIVDTFRARIKEIKSLYPNTEFSDISSIATLSNCGLKGKNKFIAVIDSLVSTPGVLLPWKQLVQVCKEEGVWSVIDGAHSIGQEMKIDIGEAQPDFFVSNCHKWLYTKRGCALLYVPYRNQFLIKSSIPTSHNYVSPCDSSSRVGTNFVQQHESSRGEVYTGTMSEKIDTALRESLFYAWNAYAAHYFYAGGWWCRCSAQIWNEVSDFEYVGNAIDTICKDIRDTILSSGKEGTTTNISCHQTMGSHQFNQGEAICHQKSSGYRNVKTNTQSLADYSGLRLSCVKQIFTMKDVIVSLLGCFRLRFSIYIATDTPLICRAYEWQLEILNRPRDLMPFVGHYIFQRIWSIMQRAPLWNACGSRRALYTAASTDYLSSPNFGQYTMHKTGLS